MISSVTTSTTTTTTDSNSSTLSLSSCDLQTSLFKTTNDNGDVKPFIVPMFVEKTIVYQLCQSSHNSKSRLIPSRVCWRWYRMVQLYNAELGSIRLNDQDANFLRRINLLNPKVNMFQRGVSKIITPCSMMSTLKVIDFAIVSLVSLEVSFAAKDFKRGRGIKSNIDHLEEFLLRLQDHQLCRLSLTSNHSVIQFDFSYFKCLLGLKCLDSLTSLNMKMAPPRFGMISEYLSLGHIKHLNLDIKPTTDNFQVDLICFLTSSSTLDNLESLYLKEFHTMPWMPLSGHTFKKLHTIGVQAQKPSLGFVNFIKNHPTLTKIDSVVSSKPLAQPIFLMNGITDFKVLITDHLVTFHLGVRVLELSFRWNGAQFANFFNGKVNLPNLQELKVIFYYFDPERMDDLFRFVEERTPNLVKLYINRQNSLSLVGGKSMFTSNFHESLCKQKSLQDLTIQPFTTIPEVEDVITTINKCRFINRFSFMFSQPKDISLSPNYKSLILDNYYIVKSGTKVNSPHTLDKKNKVNFIY